MGFGPLDLRHPEFRGAGGGDGGGHWGGGGSSHGPTGAKFEIDYGNEDPHVRMTPG